MRRTLLLALACLLAATATATPQTLSGREYSETILLLSQSDFDVRLGAKSVYRMGPYRQSLSDLVAEVAWTACSGKRPMDNDTLSWLAKAIGRTKQARYAGLLDYCLANVTDQKAIKYLTLARGSLEGTATSSFEGGKMDLAQIRAALPKKTGASPSELTTRHFDKVRRDQPLDEIYTQLGIPDTVSGINVPGDKVGHGPVKVRTSQYMIVFSYAGLGTIRFFYDDDKASWRLIEATSDKGLYWARQGGYFGTTSDIIASGDGADLREIAVRLHRQEQVGRDTLDRIANRVYASRQETGGKTADALAWLCKVLAKSGDGRYKPLLLDVSNSATHSTLRKYAAQAASSLPESPAEKFVPSTTGHKPAAS
jgi:hypothetical protein